MEEKYPKYLRTAKYACMLSVVSVLLGGVVIAFIYFFLINVIAEYTNCAQGTVAGNIVHALCIIVIGNVYSTLAEVYKKRRKKNEKILD